jgi:tRNA (cmo5U34)-methyltransferase
VNDNGSAPRAEEFDAQIEAAIPYYGCFHEETIDLVRTLQRTHWRGSSPTRWLDTGCGTGSLVLRAKVLFPRTSFVLADPSAPMLALAGAKLAGADPAVEFAEPAESQALSFHAASFDVITAILSHHYLDPPARRAATANCLRMLRSGGLFVTFENIRPFSPTGLAAGLDRCRAFQLREGRGPAAVDHHLARFDREYFPLTIGAHLDLLREAGFACGELLWASHLQAGFWALKA